MVELLQLPSYMGKSVTRFESLAPTDIVLVSSDSCEPQSLFLFFLCKIRNQQDLLTGTVLLKWPIMIRW